MTISALSEIMFSGVSNSMFGMGSNRQVSYSAMSSVQVGLPDPLTISMMVLLAAKMEEILTSVQNRSLESLKQSIAGNRKEILSLQSEVHASKKLIENLKLNSNESKEKQEILEMALCKHNELLVQIDHKISEHDALISQLQVTVLQNREEATNQNEEISKKLKNAIDENKSIISQIQKQIAAINEFQSVLSKYPDMNAAIKKCDLRAVELFLEHGADPNEGMSEHNQTPLHLSVVANHLGIFNLLLEHGANVTATTEFQKDPWGTETSTKTAIHFAAEVGNAEMIKTLHEKGLDINKGIRLCMTPYAPSTWCINSPLHIAASKGHYDAIVMLVNLGADVNVGKTPGRTEIVDTPLEVAAKKLNYADNPKNLDLIKFLVEKGAVRNSTVYNQTNFGDGRFPVKIFCDVINGYLKSVSR